MLDKPGALEDEIAQLLIESAMQHARLLFDADETAPAGEDLYTRAVRGVHAQLVAQKEAADEAEKLRQYAETDAYLARVKAGQDEP